LLISFLSQIDRHKTSYILVSNSAIEIVLHSVVYVIRRVIIIVDGVIINVQEVKQKKGVRAQQVYFDDSPPSKDLLANPFRKLFYRITNR